MVEDKNIQIKEKLAAALLESQNFMSAANTANAKLRDFQAIGASEVVQGLKPELALLKGNSNKLTSLISLSKQTPASAKESVDSQALAALTDSINSYNDNMSSNFKNLLNALKAKGIHDVTPHGEAQEKEISSAKSDLHYLHLDLMYCLLIGCI